MGTIKPQGVAGDGRDQMNDLLEQTKQKARDAAIKDFNGYLPHDLERHGAVYGSAWANAYTDQYLRCEGIDQPGVVNWVDVEPLGPVGGFSEKN